MLSNKKANKHPEEKVKTAAMRHPALYIMSIVVFAAIIVAFILGPALGRGTATVNMNNTTFGRFRGERIQFVSGSYFARAYENQLQQMEQSAQSQQRTLGLQDAYQAARNAYDSTVFRLGLLREAELANLTVSTQEVVETLANADAYKDENGNFSSAILQNAMSANPNLRQDMREDIMAAKVQQDLFAYSSLSDAEIDFIAAMGDDRRIFDIVSFEFSALPEAQVTAYMNEHSELFQSAVISSITLPNLEAAEDAKAQLDSGEISFEELARTLSTDIYASEDGLRGTVWYYDMQDDFPDANAAQSLFALASGEISDIYEIRNERYAIYRMEEDVQAADAASEEVQAQVLGYMLSFERGLIADTLSAEAESFTERVSEIGWASALTEAGYEATTTSSVGINYGDLALFPTYQSVSNGALSGVANRETLITDLFSLELGETSDAVELQDRIVVVRYAEPGESTEGQNDFLRLYIPYLTQEYVYNEMQREFSSPDNLRDNFDEAFRNLFLSN